MCGSLAPSWPCLSFSIYVSRHSTAPTNDNNNDGAQSKQQQQWTGNIWASLAVFNNNNDDDTKLTESMSPWSLRVFPFNLIPWPCLPACLPCQPSPQPSVNDVWIENWEIFAKLVASSFRIFSELSVSCILSLPCVWLKWVPEDTNDDDDTTNILSAESSLTQYRRRRRLPCRCCFSRLLQLY